MREPLFSHLAFLYGDAVAEKVFPRLLDLTAKYRNATVPSLHRESLGLTERDAMLITYGDQVREPDAPPLHALGEFLDRNAGGVVSAVHILPFYPSSSDDGFSVQDYFAVDSALGEWQDIERIGRRFDLMFDAVFNHASAQGEWFRRFLKDDRVFRDFFVTVEGEPDLSQVVRPRALPLLTTFQAATGPRKVWTTFSADQADLNFKNPDALLKIVEALLLYAARGAKFVRLDAIAYLWKEIGTPSIHLPQTHRVVQLMRAVLDDVAPQVALITETNVPHADNISYFGNGSNEAQLVYNFALPPLVLHSIATGNAEKLSDWAAALKLPSDRVTFFNFLASHDGIGVNPARGILSETEINTLEERARVHGGFVSHKHNPDGSKSPYELNINYFDALSNPSTGEPLALQIDRFVVAHAIMLSLSGMPAIYFHSLFGSRGDRAGAEDSGIPRRINRQKLTRNELDRELDDPTSLRSRVFVRLNELLRQRRSNPAFQPCGQQEVLRCDPQVFAVRRMSPDGRDQAVCLHNVSSEEVRTSLSLAGSAWRFAEPSTASDVRLEKVMPPYSVCWIVG